METKRRAADLFMKASFLLCEEAVKTGRVKTISDEEMEKVLNDLDASYRESMKDPQPHP
jgi:hypothetical protein